MPDFQEIEPNTDALDNYLRKHMPKHRDIVMRCVNRIVNPHKVHDKTYIYDSWGYVIAIKCYASKRWCPLEGPAAVAFGKRGGTKGATKTGYDRRSKKARKAWDFAAETYKEQEASLKEKLVLGELTRDEYDNELYRIIDIRAATFKDWDEGFATVEDCIEYLKKHGLFV